MTTPKDAGKAGHTLTDQDVVLLRRLYNHTGGKSWEPKAGTQSPFFDRAIAAGYVRRVDGRCLFERFKDSHIAFTPAGHAALSTSTGK